MQRSLSLVLLEAICFEAAATVCFHLIVIFELITIFARFSRNNHVSIVNNIEQNHMPERILTKLVRVNSDKRLSMLKYVVCHILPNEILGMQAATVFLFSNMTWFLVDVTLSNMCHLKWKSRKHEPNEMKFTSDRGYVHETCADFF